MRSRFGFAAGRFGAVLALATAAALAGGTGAAQAQETVKIGFIGPLSGGNAQQGLSARNGFQLAIDQANASGLPFKIEPVILDDAANPQTGVSAALKLTNDSQVVAATGHWNSGVALATIPVFQRAGVPFIVWGAISPKITERNNPMVSRVVTTLVNTNEPLAVWAAKDLGQSIAIVSDTSDYGVANTKNFEKFYTAAGGKIVATEAAPVGTTDFRALLTKIKALSPDAIYFGGVVTEAALVRQQMVELGITAPMIGVDGFHDAEFIKIAGPAAEGTIAGIVKEKGNPQLAKLTEDYRAAHFAEPATTYTKNAYDAANIIVAALRKAGTKDKAAIAKAIRETQYDGAMGHTSFDENGQTKLPVELELRTVKNGSWTTR
ncbi:branched-chain amino acid ABC transporter substrate-binding protein [Methylobacterium aerolatum]|uniref:Branched-chain amino acid transport system substrate-binding protein n=1 Tax=Methylobacterium aerolatum TaxID=418708 RepID=A0ABU0I2C4_9HYPH|nr:branched-chain amino acid ABC transporter substrate-binding protein [Methylobacterium aerolatum]MDQ0448744.1 branched-chain amino acid transport system substrate-binding protein [Methylobacterium aerolatum]GJD34932.1 Leucine-, isoleucine-, valine-, threonine-, and alanine-binding protein [Methylobacterium aerolatum]